MLEMPSLSCPMPAQVCLIPGVISDLFAQVSTSGKIARDDHYLLSKALLEDSLTEDERESIKRVLHALKRGQLKLEQENLASKAYSAQ
jgi:hypothetical protein